MCVRTRTHANVTRVYRRVDSSVDRCLRVRRTMTAVEAPFVLSSARGAPPAATLTKALAAGGRHFSLLTDTSIVIFAVRRHPDRLEVAATIPCPDGPEAHAWAQDGSLLVIASSRRIQVSHRCLTPIPSLCLTSYRFTMY